MRSRLAYFGLVSLVIACQLGRATPGAPPPGTGDLASILEPIRASADMPALAGAIVTEEGAVHVGVTGVRKAGDPTPAEIEDPFHLGSDTKAMTAVVVGRAVDDGKLTFETTIAEVFPEWVGSIEKEYETATVDHLLAHRSGLPANLTRAADLLADADDWRKERAAFVHDALQKKPVASPGAKFVYSNVGYVAVAAMVERRVGRSWEELVREDVWAPLHMDGAGLGPAGTVGNVDAPWGHRPLFLWRVPQPPTRQADNPPVISPAGRAHMSMRSWALFIADQLKSFDGKGKLLQQATYEHLHTPAFGGDYAGGWRVSQRDWAGGKMYGHDGSNTMNYATARLAPAKHFAVLAATNQEEPGGQAACDAAAKALIELHDRAGLR